MTTMSSSSQAAEIEATSPFSASFIGLGLVKEFAAAGPGCAAANGLLNGFETTKVKLQLHNTANPVYSVPTTRGS